MNRRRQTCDESRDGPSNLGRCNPTPIFSYVHDGGKVRSPSEDSNSRTVSPGMFCQGTAQNATTSMSDNLSHLVKEGPRRSAMDDLKPLFVEGGNSRLPEQKPHHHGGASLDFADTFNHHPALDVPNFKYDLVSSHISSHSYQPQNLQFSEEKSRGIPGKGIHSQMDMDGNGSVAISGIITKSPMTIKGNSLRQQSSPATAFLEFTRRGVGVRVRHTDQNGSTQLVVSAAKEDIAGYSEEADITSLSEAPGHSKDKAISLDENSISHEGSLMSIFEGTANTRKRASGPDSFQMNVSSTSNMQNRLSEQEILLTRHTSLPVPLKQKDLPSREYFPQDAVPCRLRAKRGCATHPRSIAERVRRTRISERMRKLQELVPNMDKQSNIADMLDEAVQYVKFLQRNVQELTESRARCEHLCQQQSHDSRLS